DREGLFRHRPRGRVLASNESDREQAVEHRHLLLCGHRLVEEIARAAIDAQSLRRGMAVDRPCGRAESHLQPQFETSLTASLWRHAYEFERRRQMCGCFGVGRALERALAGLAPVLDSRLAHSSLDKVTRQNLRLIFGDFSELAFEG